MLIVFVPDSFPPVGLGTYWIPVAPVIFAALHDQWPFVPLTTISLGVVAEPGASKHVTVQVVPFGKPVSVKVALAAGTTAFVAGAAKMESADAANRAAISSVTVIFTFCFILPSNSLWSCRIIRSNFCHFP
jgi:hypothetical protein